MHKQHTSEFPISIHQQGNGQRTPLSFFRSAQICPYTRGCVRSAATATTADHFHFISYLASLVLEYINFTSDTYTHYKRQTTSLLELIHIFSTAVLRKKNTHCTCDKTAIALSCVCVSV